MNITVQVSWNNYMMCIDVDVTNVKRVWSDFSKNLVSITLNNNSIIDITQEDRDTGEIKHFDFMDVDFIKYTDNWLGKTIDIRHAVNLDLTKEVK